MRACVRSFVHACVRGVSACMCFDDGFVGLRVKNIQLWLIPCFVFKYIYIFIFVFNGLRASMKNAWHITENTIIFRLHGMTSLSGLENKGW